MSSLLLDAVHIIDIVGPSKEIEDCRTPDTVDLGQIAVIADALNVTRDESGVYDSLDGKQRSNTISEYLHDEFALSTDTPAVVDDNGCVEDVSGLYFSQLPEWAQDKIKDYNLTIYYYEGMTEAEVREFFQPGVDRVQHFAVNLNLAGPLPEGLGGEVGGFLCDKLVELHGDHLIGEPLWKERR